MNATDLIARLKAMEPELRQSGLGSLYLVGSWARGDHRPDSDVDLLFEVAASAEKRFSLFDHGGLICRLQEELEASVDLVERRALRPRIRAFVEPDLVRIF